MLLHPIYNYLQKLFYTVKVDNLCFTIIVQPPVACELSERFRSLLISMLSRRRNTELARTV